MAYKLAALLAASYAAGVLAQTTAVVSACSRVNGQEVCLGPGGSTVTFTSTATTASITGGPASTAASETASAAGTSVTAVSECHYHGSSPFCFAGTREYEVIDVPTRTEELAAQYTDCHSHGSEMFCVGPDGSDVEVRAEGSTAEEDNHDHDHDGEDHDHGVNGTESSTAAAATPTGAAAGLSCHFHGGVEHCVAEGESEGAATVSCERQDREYNVPLRIGMLFVVLCTSTIGVFTPILMASLLKNRVVSFVLLQLKQFGTGVLVSTAFIHLYTHAELLLTSPCISWPVRYEGTTAAFIMAGIFLSFLTEYIGSRIIMRKFERSTASEEVASSRDSAADSSEESTKTTAEASLAHMGHGGGHHGVSTHQHPQQQKLSVMVVEAGILFHSIILGLTLIVAGDSVFGSLVVVIIFHQMFEGIALGTRIAELPSAPVNGVPGIRMLTKYLYAGAFALITPLGMAIGIAVLDSFNGNDPATLLTIGILDAVSGGILIWVALVEMWAGDWLHGPLARASLKVGGPSMFSLMLGMILMSLLGKWA